MPKDIPPGLDQSHSRKEKHIGCSIQQAKVYWQEYLNYEQL
jgi:hypothetical protein